jgi:acyl transferase domain-containing protein
MIIAINAFGFGGSNSHCILQEPPREPESNHVNPNCWQFDPSCQNSGPYLGLPLSAANLHTLKMLVSRWASFTLPNVDASSVIARAALYRSSFPQRAFIVASSHQEFINNALAFSDLPEGSSTSAGVIFGKVGKSTRPGLLFSGQGAQHITMGRELYKSFPVFRDIVQLCDSKYEKLTGSSFLTATGLFISDTCLADMSCVDISQPAICFYQIGVYELLRHYGITPSVVVGHSLGEIAAAYASGRFGLDDALRMVMVRSVLQKRHEGRGMISTLR